jgi:enamine deaminase RidA (YjgF/YER057c/UK114 family)
MQVGTAGLDYRVLNGSGVEELSKVCGSLGAAAASQVLGAQVLSQSGLKPVGDFPVQAIRMPRLGGDGSGSDGAIATAFAAATPWSAELWLSGGDCRQGQYGSIRFSCDGALLYGVLQVHAHELPSGTPDGIDQDQEQTSPLQQASTSAYAQIFALLEAEGYPHLWRVWNYLSDINDASDGLERYRQFNVGRHQAFEAQGRLNVQAVPAACALGTRDSEVPLSIAFLAAREMPLVIENPRQVAAYDYPAKYGPRSPTFARAALAQLPGLSILFISGTASIIGHASVHPGDVQAQTRETLVNIQALLEEAIRVGESSAWHLRDISYRAYLRHATDYAAVQAVLSEHLGAEARIEFFQADVCRTELLVEIEAVGVMPDAQTDACPKT